ncbi:MAG: DUF4412 domain-containing protein [Terriglobales bacterium]
MRRQALCISLLSIVLAAAAAAQLPSQFAADFKFASPKGGAGSGKMFFGGEKYRMEMNMMGHDMIMIADMKKKVVDMVMVEQHMYMENSTEGSGPRRGPDWHAYDASNPCANQPEMTCKKVGEETVNGFSCDKWQFTSTGKGAGKDRTVWIDQKTHIPVKSVDADGGTFEMTSIKEGAQNPSLFEVPAGYTKMDMGNMMQNMGKPH